MTAVAQNLRLSLNGKTHLVRKHEVGLELKRVLPEVPCKNTRDTAIPHVARSLRAVNAGGMPVTDHDFSRPIRRIGNPNNRARGFRVRAALLALVRDCHARGLPMPSHNALTLLTDCDTTQVARHLARLMDEGLFNIVMLGGRAYVEEIAP